MHKALFDMEMTSHSYVATTSPYIRQKAVTEYLSTKINN